MDQLKRGRPAGQSKPLSNAEKQKRHRLREENPEAKSLLLDLEKTRSTNISVRLPRGFDSCIQLLAFNIFASSYSQMVNVLFTSRWHQVEELVNAAHAAHEDPEKPAPNNELRSAIKAGLTAFDIESSSLEAAIADRDKSPPDYPGIQLTANDFVEIPSVRDRKLSSARSSFSNAMVKRNVSLGNLALERITAYQNFLGLNISGVIRLFLNTRLLQILEINNLYQKIANNDHPELIRLALAMQFKRAIGTTTTPKRYSDDAKKLIEKSCQILRSSHCEREKKVTALLVKYIEEGTIDA